MKTTTAVENKYNGIDLSVCCTLYNMQGLRWLRITYYI